MQRFKMDSDVEVFLFVLIIMTGTGTVSLEIGSRKRSAPIIVKCLYVLLMLQVNAGLPFINYVIYNGILKHNNMTINEATIYLPTYKYITKATDVVLFSIEPEHFLSSCCWHTKSLMLDMINWITIAMNFYLLVQVVQIIHRLCLSIESRKLVGRHHLALWIIHIMKIGITVSTYCFLAFALNFAVSTLSIWLMMYKLSEKMIPDVTLNRKNIYDRRYLRTVQMANSRSSYAQREATQRNERETKIAVPEMISQHVMETEFI